MCYCACTGPTGITGGLRQINILRPIPQARCDDTPDQDIVLETRDGSLERTAPDNTSVGGNCRGRTAVDFQVLRSAASQVASGDYSVISGGINNTASDRNSVVGGGNNNLNLAILGTIAGGGGTFPAGTVNQPDSGNQLETGADGGSIGGGSNNRIIPVTTIPPPLFDHSVIAGGQNNTITAQYATISGGQGNTVAVQSGVIGGGTNNTITSSFGGSSVIAGGNGNTINGEISTIAGGYGNSSGVGAVVGGGQANRATNVYSTVGGGFGNLAAGYWSSIGGGLSNTITANAPYGAIPGGRGLSLTQPASAAVGQFNNPSPTLPTAGIEVNHSGAPIGVTLTPGSLIFMVGNGTSSTSLSNAMSVDIHGNVYAEGAFVPGGADYAEYFESVDGSKIPLGTSVVFDHDDLIRPAQPGEIPIGVVTSTGGIIGNGAPQCWAGKYERDEQDEIVYEEYAHSYTLLEPTHQTPSNRGTTASVPPVETYTQVRYRPKVSAQYDPTRPYVPRALRPEWHPIGLIGKVKILQGQPVAPNWIKLKPAGSNKDYWFIR